MLLDCFVHCIWSEVQITRPRNCAIIEPGLCKERRFRKQGENTCIG
jgi:hypothetical protein